MSGTENEAATTSANQKVENVEEVNEASGDQVRDDELIEILKQVALDKKKTTPPSPLKSPKKRRRKVKKVKEETATIVKNPNFDPKRQAQR